jgi:hypothetical protein
MAHRITTSEVRDVLIAEVTSRRAQRRKAAREADAAFLLARGAFLGRGGPTTWPRLVTAARALFKASGAR